jgi:hypothetical protein
MLFAFVSCQDDAMKPEQIEIATPVGEFTTYAVTQKVLARAKRLVHSLNNASNGNPKARLANNEVDYATAKVTVNNITGAVHYSFEVGNGKNDFTFDNLIIQDLDDTLVH